MNMTVYLSNAFSLSMLSFPANISVSEISVDQVKQLLGAGFVSAVGHEATAQVLSQKLGIPVQLNRIQLSLKSGDSLIVFQLLFRLPEGKILSEEEIKSLPAKWLFVKVL